MGKFGLFAINFHILVIQSLLISKSCYNASYSYLTANHDFYDARGDEKQLFFLSGLMLEHNPPPLCPPPPSGNINYSCSPVRGSVHLSWR